VVAKLFIYCHIINNMLARSLARRRWSLLARCC